MNACGRAGDLRRPSAIRQSARLGMNFRDPGQGLAQAAQGSRQRGRLQCSQRGPAAGFGPAPAILPRAGKAMCPMSYRIARSAPGGAGLPMPFAPGHRAREAAPAVGSCRKGGRDTSCARTGGTAPPSLPAWMILPYPGRGADAGLRSLIRVLPAALATSCERRDGPGNRQARPRRPGIAPSAAHSPGHSAGSRPGSGRPR